MKRTPPWVFVAAVGVQLAALGLCLWAMELHARTEEAVSEPPAPPPPEPAPRRDALAWSPPLPAAEPAFRRPEPEAVPEPVWAAPRAVEPPGVRFGEPPGFAAQAAEPEPRPLFGPPPARPDEPPESYAMPPFIVEAADESTQVVVGEAAEGPFAFGFYPDGNIRFVDVDGGRFAGKAESARARMREVDGMRAFTVQIGVAPDGRLQATFTGGPHDAETIPLEPLVGWSAA